MNTLNATPYNGWTNYVTWMVKLWIDNEEASQTYWLEAAEGITSAFSKESEREKIAAFAACLKDEFEESASEHAKGVHLDLMMCALADVNWHEIATHLLEEA